MDWSVSPNAPKPTASSAAAPIAGAAVGGFETALQYKLNAAEAEKAYERQQKLLRQQYDYNQLAQKESAANLVESAKRAGLSPVAVTGQSFSPAGVSSSGVSAAQVSKPDLSPDRVVNGMDLMGAQVANLAAQNANIAADTRSKQIDNARKEDADSVVNENFRSHFQAIVDKFAKLGIDVSELENKIDEIDSGDRKYTVGALLTNELFERYRARYNENLPSYDKAYLDTIVANLKANNEKVWEALSNNDIAAFRKLKNEVVNVYEDTQKKVTEQKLNEEQISHIENKIKEICVQIRKEISNNPALALDVGDVDAFERWMLLDVYGRSLDFGAEVLGKRLGKTTTTTIHKNETKPYNKTTTEEFKQLKNSQKHIFKEEYSDPLQLNYHQPRQRFKRKRYYYG